MRADGTVFPVELAITETQHGGSPIFVGYIRDITQRKQAELAQRFLSQASTLLASSLDYAITLQTLARLTIPELADACLIDVRAADGTIRRLAVAHQEPRKEVLLRELIAYPPDPSKPHPVVEALQSGIAAMGEQLPATLLAAIAHDSRHLRIMTELHPRSYIVAPLVARGQALGVLTFWITDSDRRYHSADLALAEALASRAALAVDNAQLYREAQQAIQVREEFLAIASHELKTPLTTIKAYGQLLARQLLQPNLDHDRLSGLVQQLHRQTDRLEQLVNHLLDASRIQQGRLELHPEPINLPQLAQQVLERFEHAPERSPAHRFVLAAAAAIKGSWDPARLDQVLTNLVANAVKYSPEGGEVRLAMAQQDGQVLVAVSDQGIGIPREAQAQLFQPFVRLASERQRIGGQGLGLYITKQIVEQHGGMITVESEPGKGSTFTVSLPLSPAETSASSA